MMRKILVVDDDMNGRLLLRRTLEAKHFQVAEAQDGNEALARAKETPSPDVIILDLMMSRMDGILVYDQLQKDAQTRSIPVLFLTAIGSNSYMTNQSISLMAFAKYGIELVGSYQVMGKPYEIQDLIKKVQGMLKPE